MTVGPIVPTPKPVTLDAKKTALLVLDQNEQVRDPKLFPSGNKLIPSLTRLLAKARDNGVHIVFTYSLFLKGTPDGKVYCYNTQSYNGGQGGAKKAILLTMPSAGKLRLAKASTFVCGAGPRQMPTSVVEYER